MFSKISTLCSTGMFILTPSASNTSAAPHLLVAALFPCLATGTPAADTTMDEIVDILNEFDLSPPVPTISIKSSL
ncbi:hypothetical protein SDC9_106339 [bioreactor metagenome]|uniref:Uncharacterized protein n=1 Tax=bioreactor metagenome TaxID=1076179 RepID=A0A645B225_9ZZZZ